MRICETLDTTDRTEIITKVKKIATKCEDIAKIAEVFSYKDYDWHLSSFVAYNLGAFTAD